MLLNQIKNLVDTTPADAYEMGAAARYKRINEKWGFKFYFSRHTAKHTYILQRAANALGCGPRLGRFMQVEVPQYGKAFGYVTEHITTLLCDYRPNGRGWYDDAKTNLKYNKLRETLRSNGFDCCDMHAKNVAIRPSGRMLAIDFSHMTWTHPQDMTYKPYSMWNIEFPTEILKENIIKKLAPQTVTP